jgi:hypothetical protein
MRTLVTALAACAAVVVVAGSALAMSPPSVVNCAAVATPTGLTSKVNATNVSCTTARKVAKAFAVHGKAKGWSCSAKPYQGGAKATCRRTVMKTKQAVRFEIAD